MLTRKQHELLMLIHARLQEEGIPPSFDEMKDALDLKSKSGIHRLITALEERGFIRRLPNRARALEVIKLPEGYDPGRHAGLQAGPDSGLHPAQGSARHPAGPAAPGFTPRVVEGSGANNVTAVDFGRSAAGRNSHDRASHDSGHDFGQVSGRRGGIAGRYGKAGTASPATGRTDGASGGLEETAGSYEVPVMGRIAAGVPIAAIQQVTSQMAVPPSMIGMGRHFALEVQGDSMIEAGILDGDTVIIQETPTALEGDIVVALVDDEEATLKKFFRKDGKIALKACNPAYETRVLTADRVKVQGKLAGLVRKY